MNHRDPLSRETKAGCTNENRRVKVVLKNLVTMGCVEDEGPKKEA